MSSSISRKEFITKLALQMGTNEETADRWLNGIVNTLSSAVGLKPSATIKEAHLSGLG